MNWVLHITQSPRSNYFLRRHLRLGPSCSVNAGQTRPHIVQHNSDIWSIMVMFPSLLPPQEVYTYPNAQEQEAGCLFLRGGCCISRVEHVSSSRSCHCISPESLQQWHIVCYFLPQSFYPIVGQTLQAKIKQLCAFFYFAILFFVSFLGLWILLPIRH